MSRPVHLTAPQADSVERALDRLREAQGQMEAQMTWQSAHALYAESRRAVSEISRALALGGDRAEREIQPDEPEVSRAS